MAVHPESRIVDSVPGHAHPKRGTVLLSAGVAALILVGIAAVIIAGRRQEVVYPPSSPQRTVATYIRHLQNGQVDEAYAMTSLSDEVRGRVPLTFFHQIYDNWGRQSHRVTLIKAHITGKRASVAVEITTFQSGVFGGSDQTTRQTFTLVQRHGMWRITGPEFLGS